MKPNPLNNKNRQAGGHYELLNVISRLKEERKELYKETDSLKESLDRYEQEFEELRDLSEIKTTAVHNFYVLGLLMICDKYNINLAGYITEEEFEDLKLHPDIIKFGVFQKESKEYQILCTRKGYRGWTIAHIIISYMYLDKYGAKFDFPML